MYQMNDKEKVEQLEKTLAAIVKAKKEAAILMDLCDSSEENTVTDEMIITTTVYRDVWYALDLLKKLRP